MINNDHSNNRNDNTLKDAKIEQFITTTINSHSGPIHDQSFNKSQQRETLNLHENNDYHMIIMGV